MGYSSPKKPLDLKEFLSTPAKRRPGAKGFGSYRSASAKAAATTRDDATSTSTPGDAAPASKK